jgi:hypothetical protein
MEMGMEMRMASGKGTVRVEIRGRAAERRGESGEAEDAMELDG